jgi:uncharacterized cofD-like protein
MHIKRWLGAVLVGLTILALGAAILLIEVYRRFIVEFPDIATFFGAGLERELRGAIVITAGVVLTAFGLWKLMHSLVSPFVSSGDSVMEVLYTKRYLARGPRIVALGGGTGLSTLLRGLKAYSANITAVVAVADDGGSSGRLRQQLGIVPPGDIRNCIAALADAEPLMTQLMQYRFPPGSGLDDHAFGNLFIAAMTAVTGDFDEAVRESNRVLAVRGQVLPATSVPLNLTARLESGRFISGQAAVSQATEPIAKVQIDPSDVRANPEAIERILEADLVVIGPGSLYSSVLPNLLISDIHDALSGAEGLRVYVCNVATQPGETDGYSASRHLTTLFDHAGDQLFDMVLLNRNRSARRPSGWQGQPVQLDTRQLEELPVVVVEDDVIDDQNAHHHDPDKLAAVLLRLLEDDKPTRQQRRIRRPVATAS